MSEQNTKTDVTRRRLLFSSAAALGAGVLATTSTKAFARACGVQTPGQTEGPFYPIEDQLDKDTDLTFVDGGAQKAKGQVIYISGNVLDQHCKPVKGAIVEIWQAAASGKYNHPGDDSEYELDPNFQYWGRALTDDKGFYKFKTIKPGKYKTAPGSTWVRPPHIHVKVHKRGFSELTTQFYFTGDPLNKKDYILNNIPQNERKHVMVKLEKAQEGDGHEPGSQFGSRDIFIEKIEV